MTEANCTYAERDGIVEPAECIDENHEMQDCENVIEVISCQKISSLDGAAH
jgi:hypothetical protein